MVETKINKTERVMKEVIRRKNKPKAVYDRCFCVEYIIGKSKFNFNHLKGGVVFLFFKERPTHISGVEPKNKIDK